MSDDATAADCTMACVMGHTNEPGCLYDTTPKPQQTSAGETGRREATPWWEMPPGMERELAKYDQCEDFGDCDHDHDNAIEYFREQELNELRAERDAANERAEAAERALEEMRGRMADHLRRRAHDAAVADVNGYSCTEAATLMTAAQYVETGEWKATTDA